MAKKTLTPSQQQGAEVLNSALKELISLKDKLQGYKLEDIYLLEWKGTHPSNSWTTQQTALKFPRKYKVVFISSEGIPFLRELSAACKPIGSAYIPPEANVLSSLHRFIKQDIDSFQCHLMNPLSHRFVPDPEQLDSILLQEEFDPMVQHREKSKLFNDINKHNKSAAIPTGKKYQKMIYFFKTRRPGDTFWTSPDTLYIFKSLIKQDNIYQISCIDMDQKEVSFGFSDFRHKRLYKEQPRSFIKESKV